MTCRRWRFCRNVTSSIALWRCSAWQRGATTSGMCCLRPAYDILSALMTTTLVLCVAGMWQISLLAGSRHVISPGGFLSRVRCGNGQHDALLFGGVMLQCHSGGILTPSYSSFIAASALPSVWAVTGIPIRLPYFAAVPFAAGDATTCAGSGGPRSGGADHRRGMAPTTTTCWRNKPSLAPFRRAPA